MANFDYYFDLYDKRNYREAYAVLRDIMEIQPRWSKVGDLYVWCADLELLVNDNIYKARQLLDKACELGCSDMASYYNTRGYVSWRTGERDSGIQDIERSVALDPSITNLKILAKVLSSDRDRNATSICHRIFEHNPKNCSAHIYLGMEAAKSGDRGKALLMIKRAERLNPTACDFFEIGRLYHELEQFKNAVNAYIEANRRHYEPKGTLYGAIATCYFSLGDYDAAIEYASKGVALNFNDNYAKDVLLWSVEKKGAGPILDRLVEENRDTCLAFILLAQQAFKQKDFSRAREMVSKAKQFEPSPIEMYHIGRLCVNLGHFEKALNAYLECERLGYNNKGLLYDSIASCYLYLEDSGAAIQYASRALDLDFNDDYAKDILLWSAEKEGAGSILDKMVEEHRDTCLTFILLAQEAFRGKNLSKARKMLSKAENLEPSPAEMYNISHIYYDIGLLENALDACLKSEKLGYTNKGRLYTSIADCYYRLDDYDAAIQYAIKSLAIDPNDEYMKNILYACREALWGSDFGDNY
ncbi:MAG TPA: CDC27 family protein [Sedimentisphaerales bacterium]|nr:CDC27 family protein [Sedimentisphaerales bacterium]